MMDRQTGSVLGTSLRREYPGLVKKYAGPGQHKRKRLAMSWGHYFGKKDKNGMTAGDRVKDEFWSFFTAQEEDMEELDKNIDNYCQARVPKIICQARVDAVKKYYGKGIKGKNASAIELNFEQYMTCKLDWINVEAWKCFCHWWTSDKYREKHKRGQDARFANEDYAQHSTARRISSILYYTAKLEKASGLDTYKVQMAGFKASLRGSGQIRSEKVKQRINTYCQVYHDEHGEEQQPVSSELDGNVVYKAFGGLKHGRFAMGNGVFKKTEVLAAVKCKKSRMSGATNSYSVVVRENAQLHHEMTEQRGMIREQRGMLKAVYEKLGMDIPEEVLARWESQR
uniref:Uncharacterized protein n=1 Tax=Oryza punctata TaxID=4537 RepID=A0A0E0M5M5_ORYPU